MQHSFSFTGSQSSLQPWRRSHHAGRTPSSCSRHPLTAPSTPSAACACSSAAAAASSASASPDGAPPLEHQVQAMQAILQEQREMIEALRSEVTTLRCEVTAGGATAAAAAADAEAARMLTACPAGTSYKCLSLEDYRALPDKIILVRHAQSQGNISSDAYTETPDYEVPLSALGWHQATACGEAIRDIMEADHGPGYKLFFLVSPYCRTRQTFVGVRQAFPDRIFAGLQEEVQLREQDFGGSFQDAQKMRASINDRNKYGRFYFRFPDGEATSDVYNRISIFEDHLIRDMRAGRFGSSTQLVLITHGITLRVFLMRWFNWTVEQFLQAFNPPNAQPIVIEKVPEAQFLCRASSLERRQTMQVKQAYRLRKDSLGVLQVMAQTTVENMDLVAQEFM